jgi:hypothetical protein
LSGTKQADGAQDAMISVTGAIVVIGKKYETGGKEAWLK